MVENESYLKLRNDAMEYRYIFGQWFYSEKEYNYTFRDRDYLHQVYALDCAGV
jgi:hypothetical protein